MSEDPLAREVLDACHALAVYGLGSVIGGHVSIRVPGERRYWTNALDRAFEEMTIDLHWKQADLKTAQHYFISKAHL